MDLDTVVDELYALPPEEFTAARDAAASAASDRDVRARIKALRRPTAAAHAVNALVRDRPGDVAALLDLGEQLRAAMGGEPTAVRRLTGQRRELIASLVGADRPAAVQQNVTATLEAATADPDLAAAVRSGRLVKPLRYAGFGALPDLDDAVAGSAPAGRGSSRSAAGTGRARPSRGAGSRAGRSTAPAEPAGPTAAELTAARAHVLELVGRADDAQRRFERADRSAAEARELLARAEAERDAALEVARGAHEAAEAARQELGRLERG